MKNKIYSYTLSGLFLLAITALSVIGTSAQGRYINTYSKSTVSGFINRLETSSNTFRRDFDRYMDRSNLDGTREEDRLNQIVANYEDALDRLRSDFSGRRNWWDSRSDVQQMISQAGPVNTMMVRLPFGRNIETQWRAMRNDINKVADTYDLPGLAGGGWNGGGGSGGGGWNGGGNRINPPSWAVGTFYGTDSAGRRITVTISRNGNVSADADGTPFNGAFTSGNNLSFADGTSRVTREGNGFWTTRSSNGERTFFSNRFNGGGGNDGGGNSDSGNRINPPDWAVGNFNGTDSAGRRISINITRNGDVYANADGIQFSGTFIRGNLLSFADGTSRVTREGNGFWTTRTSNGERTFFRR